MSVMGRFLPVRTLPPRRQLPGAERSFHNDFRQLKSDRLLLRMKQSVKPLEKRCRDRRESAISGPERRCDDMLPTRGLSENAGRLHYTW